MKTLPFSILDTLLPLRPCPGALRRTAWRALLGCGGALWLGAAAPMAQETNTAAERTNTPASAGVMAEAEGPAAEPAASVRAAGGADRNVRAPGAARTRPTVDRDVIVALGRDVVLKTNESAEVVVVIGGSAKIHGKVRQAVVVVDGDIEVDGEVGDAVVAVLGNIRAGQGADLHLDAVAILGNLKAESKSTIHGDAVTFGGQLDLAEGATVSGQRQEVGMVGLAWLRAWLVHCVFKLRPLAFQVGWVWVIAGVVFLFYLLVAAAFPRPVLVCVEALDQRPATTLVLGLLAKLIVPIVALILALTGIGLLVLPFLSLAVFIGGVLGKIALLEWIGGRIGQQSGIRVLQKPLLAFVLGSLILTAFYLVWVVGLLAYILFSMWGLGVAATAVLGRVRRRSATKAVFPAPAAAPATPFAAAPFSPPAGSLETDDAAANFTQTAPPAQPPTLTPPSSAVAVPEILSYPRAGFWDRLGAGFLDVVLLGFLGAFVNGAMPWLLLIALAYFAGLWTWRGTTIGGIVLGLKVVRLDGQPVAFTVALVRALAAAFSIMVLFLGFLWIAWDLEKQGWHDRIAGTAVIRLPRGTPLVSL